MVVFSNWTLLCGGYHLFGLVFYHQLCNWSYFHVCYCNQSGFACSLQFVSSQLQMECQRACLIWIYLHLVRPSILCGMLSKLLMLHCQWRSQYQQDQLNQPCLVQRCASWFLGPDSHAHKWHLLVDSQLWLVHALCRMNCIMFQSVIWTQTCCHIKYWHLWYLHNQMLLTSKPL